MKKTVRIYLPNGHSIVFKEGKNRVESIEENNNRVEVTFVDSTTRVFCHMPYELGETLR